MSTIQLRLEHGVRSEDELPTDLGSDDKGRVWWIDVVWWIWAGDGWQKAIATRGRPR